MGCVVSKRRESSLGATINVESKTICSESHEILTSKGLNKVELLKQELEQVKARLADKEKLMTCYQSRIEELRNLVQKEKCDKILENHFCMTEKTICGTDKVNQPSVYKELETTQIQLCQMEKEVTQLKKKLKDADCSIKRLRCDLVASEKNAREMRSALTAEVAEKHDQVLALRREVNQLEDQLRQADMQTHFKDDIIKELRKEVKVARSKETLVEVLGIKERSLTHLEQLTEQLEQKENMIRCLQAQLQRHGEHNPHQDTLYRVKQQVDWFTENMLQQCAHGNVPEEFKKCITTMLEELRESIECCNLGPANPLEGCKVR